MALIRPQQGNAMIRNAVGAASALTAFNDYGELQASIKRIKEFAKRNMPNGNGKRTSNGNNNAGKRRKVQNQRTRQKPNANSRRGGPGPNSAKGVEGYVVKLKRKGTKVAKEARKRKTPGVTKRFKKKVKAALSNPAPIGLYTETSAGYIALPGDGYQGVSTLSGITIDGSHCYFSPVHILDAASILWYNKIPSGIKAQGEPGNLPIQNLKIYVEDQYVQITYRNLTARTLLLKLYDCSPKTIMDSNTNSSDPSNVWGQAFQDEQPPARPPLVNRGYLNPLQNFPGVLYATPTVSPQWKNQFTSDVTSVILEAGKTYVHTLRGPSKKWYNYPAYQTPTLAFANIQKFVKYHMPVVMFDLVSTTGATVGRFQDVTAGYGLAFETKYFYKLRMPDQVGFNYPTTLPVAGDAVALSKRGYAYAFTNLLTTQTGPITDIEAENPGDLPDTGTV